MMVDNSSISGVDLSQIGLNNTIQKDSKKDDQNEFLQLFVAQLKNQNPLDPQDGSEFLSQLAQFSTVEGIRNLEGTFNKIYDSVNSSHALQASNLVGKQVQVKTELGFHQPGEKMKGTIELSQSVANLNLQIVDANGATVKSYSFATQQAGDFNFEWDGTNDKGESVPQGVYRVVASAKLDDHQIQLPTYLAANVDSVTISRNGEPVVLNVMGYGQVTLDEIKSISA